MSKDATRKEERCLFVSIDADMYRLAHDACQAKANNESSPCEFVSHHLHWHIGYVGSRCRAMEDYHPVCE